MLLSRGQWERHGEGCVTETAAGGWKRRQVYCADLISSFCCRREVWKRLEVLVARDTVLEVMKQKNHSILPATKKKINSIPAECRTVSSTLQLFMLKRIKKSSSVRLRMLPCLKSIMVWIGFCLILNFFFQFTSTQICLALSHL